MRLLTFDRHESAKGQTKHTLPKVRRPTPKDESEDRQIRREPNAQYRQYGLHECSFCSSPRKIDMVAAWSVDRLGRSLQHLLGFLNELQALGCDLYLHQQALDTSTPSGRAMFQMCGVFAEFERSMIVERVNAGLKRAKAQGVKLGRGRRKDGARSLDEERWGMTRAQLEKRILSLHKGGMGVLKIGKELGVGTGLVHGVVSPFVASAA
jgi:DNA invertase Pin-like site-specific DNA recombinase